MLISTNLTTIKNRIERACERAGRDPADVQIVAVTKTVGVEQIEEAAAAGIKIIGENRVQEAWKKFQSLSADVEWHMIGHLQSNKVARALQFADVIESVDSLHLAQEINRRAKQLNKPAEVFVQVNTSGEASKFGLEPENVVGFLQGISELEFVKVTGLMTIGAFLPDPEDVRPCFIKLRELLNSVNENSGYKFELRHLSMGMTNDYEVAVEEGATHVRIGRALFGERVY